MTSDESIEGYVPPSENESFRYLLGIGGAPRLIARTSTDRYVYEEYADEKILATLGAGNALTEHFLDIQDDIVRVLQGGSAQFEWTTIMPLRLGVHKGRYIEDPTEYPTVLIITVARSSAYSCNWANAMRMALACRAVLHQAHSALRSVEVIVAAVTVENQSRAADFMHGQIDWTVEYDKISGSMDCKMQTAMMPLLPYSGCTVQQSANLITGALGPVIRLRSSPEALVCGLTSRHVAVGPLLESNRSYKADENKKNKDLDAVVMTADADATNCRMNLEHCEAELQVDVGHMEDRLQDGQQTEAAANRLQSYRAAIAYIKTKLGNAMRDDRATAPQARTLGRVLYTPELAPGRHRNLRDWALFELPKSQKGDFTSIYVDGAAQVQATRWARFVTATTAGAPTEHDDKTEWKPVFNVEVAHEPWLRLHGRGIPVNPPYKTSSAPSTHPSSSPSSKYPYFLVAKRGPTTGLTCGVVNELGAVRRVPFSTGDSVISTAMIILPIEGFPAFSAKGDSGAAIFDMDGCIVGIVDAGSERQNISIATMSNQMRRVNAINVTFATPIQWILEDIKSFTGHDAEIA